MKKTWKFPSLISKILLPSLALFAFTQCSDEPEFAPQEPETELAAGPTGDEPVVSLTVDGVFTEFVSTLDCKTCDYVVPETATVVDGKVIGIKPGQSICLDASIHYGSLLLTNIVGEQNKPILIAYGVKPISTILEPGEEEEIIY
jgi:hypothetical protein